MTRLIALLSCGHFIQRSGAEWDGDATTFLRGQKREQHNVGCFKDDPKGHDGFVTTLLTSTVDRIWIEE
jgi:hypothetical protein